MKTEPVWRPVQYLGNKLRVLEQVRAACVQGLAPGDRVWDAFSGSSVVSQEIAAAGQPVYATDVLATSVVLARAMMGVGRIDSSLEAATKQVMARAIEMRSEIWDRAVEQERVAIASADGDSLAELGRSLPQRWRRDGASAEQLDAFDQVEADARAERLTDTGQIAATYAGTYFGVEQAVRLDALRNAILSLERDGAIDGWQVAAMLTALSFAASRSVHSAGKHFAQPLKLAPTAFHRRRLLTDRALSVDDAFMMGLTEVERSARPPGEWHVVESAEAERIAGSRLRELGVRSVYADPPYTAQQYSRFYHLLDVLVSGTPAKLQLRGDRVTTGLYPVDRHRSRFCSRTQAPAAFAELSRHVRDAGARLVVSYSVSDHASVGNARSIGLDALLELLRETFGSRGVHMEELDIRYRQFNSGGFSSPTRNDPEVLIVAEPS